MTSGPLEGCGVVYLIGAGPGDPELLTLKAAHALRRCDVVLVDALVNRAVLAHCRPGVRVLDAGKRAGAAATSQARIEALMIRLARRGAIVGRVKGGDPFVFGRGGEEAAALEAAGVPVEIVPGVTAGIAVPAAAGIAVTERGIARGAVLVTGQTCDDAEIDWASLARSGLTIVVYMGIARVRPITAALIAGGLAPSTPAAAIQDGTLPDQRAVVTTLAALADVVTARAIASPSVLVIGDVAAGVRAAAAARAA
jgi:uroporphyrin-III C-methyltransferase